MTFRPKPILCKVAFTIMMLGLLTPVAHIGVLGRSFPLGLTELGITLGLLLIITTRQIRRGYLPIHIVALILVCWVLLSCMWSVDYLRTALYSFGLVEAYLTFLISLTLSNRLSHTEFLGLLRGFEVVLMFQLLWAFRNGVIIAGFRLGVIKDQLHIPIGGSNLIAMFFEYLAIFEIALRAPRWHFFAGITLCGLILTLSRGGIISFLVGLLIYTLWYSVFSRRFQITPLALVLLISSGTLVYMWLFGGSMADWFSYIGYSLNSRVVLLHNALKAFASAPVGGVGLGCFGVWAGIPLRSPHNLVVQVLSETGLVGMLIFLIMASLVWFYLVTGEKATMIAPANTEIRATMWGLLVLSMHSMAEPFFLDSSSAIWTALILGRSLSITSKPRQHSMKGP